jgi:iron complex outermembrane receptor protein
MNADIMNHPQFRLTLVSFALVQAFGFAGSVHAQSASLPEVLVSAQRPSLVKADSASFAGFGDLPLLQTPASISVITRSQMQDLGIRQTTDAMKYDASVSDAYNAIGYAEQFSIRGFALDNATSYRKDGLAIPGDASIPLENKEAIEILKGLAGLQAGSAAPGGIVNYVTKRPTNEPLRSVSLSVSERGTRYGAVDLGGRFDDRRFGYRINAAAEALRSYVKGADGERQFVAAAFDWQLTPQALLQLDVDYQRKAQLTAPGYQLIGGTDLPRGIAADTMLNAQPWSKPVTTRTTNIGLRFEYQFTNGWQALVSANKHVFKRDDFAAFPYGCSNEALYPGYCANGDFDVYDYQSTGEKKSPLGSQALIKGQFAAAGMPHAFTAGMSTSSIRDSYGDYVYEVGSYDNFISNIYRPVIVPASTAKTGPVSLRRSEDERAVFVQDVIGLSDALSLHAGLRYTQTKRLQSNAAGALAVPYDQNAVLPNVALVFAPLNNVRVYGAFSEGLEHGGIASLGTTNVGRQLDPNKSRQFEAGVKADLHTNLSVAAAVFEITKPLEFDQENSDGSSTFVRKGNAVHRGLELSAQGQLGGGLSAYASLTALNARQQGTGNAAQDGMRVTNVPKLKSVLTLDYSLPQLPALRLSGSWQHASDKAFNVDNSVMVPSYDVASFGARYATKIAGAATTLRFTVDNAFDAFYWRDVTQSLGGYLFPGAPRTFKVAAQFDF